jgi:hypothetical protein
LVDEFHFSAVFKCFDPLFVWHFCYPYSGEISVCREYTSPLAALSLSRNVQQDSSGNIALEVRAGRW